MRHHGFVAVALASAAAATGWILSQPGAINASEETSSFREVFAKTAASDAPEEDPDGMRINYFDARWDRVLRDLAEHTGLTLVMDRVPPGRFARRDRTRYAPADCVRILNRELEGLGYRLIRQGDYLIVLHLDKARTRYARPVLQESGDTELTSGKSNNRPSDDRRSNDRPPIRTASRRMDQDRVAWASDSQPEEEPLSEPTTIPLRQPRSEENVDQPPVPKAPAGPPVTRSVEIQHGNAVDLAKSIYLVFERRAKLMEKGLEDLPTLNVYDTRDVDMTGDPLFRIAIRQEDNSLLVEAVAERVDHLVNLIEQLDKPREDGQGTKLVPADGVTEKAAERLNEQLRKLVAARARQNDEDGNGAPNVPDVPNFTDTSTFNLQGDVKVQAIPGAGILMIQGNESDLERLAPIIENLERMSVGSLPDIHLLQLQHVNSEAFADLLTTVYDRLAELRQRGEAQKESVAVFPVVQPNAVLILAPKIEMPAIQQLADKLDVEVDPESEFEIFELKNAIASQVVTALDGFYEERGGLGTRLRTFADVRTNSVIVQGRSRDLTEVKRLIERLDGEAPGSVHQVEVIELHHATAEELAEVVSGAIQAVTSPPQQAGGSFGGGFGGNQAPQELRDTKSIALEFLARDGDAQELIRSGFLVDVRINADPRSNSVIVSAPEASMALMKALIQALDQAPTATAAIKVFALKNADASQSVELLTTLFEDTNQEEQLGVQIAGAEDAASSLIPLTFSADVRTNTVLAVGSEEALSIVEAILLRLDTDDSRKRTTTVIPLRNAPAELVADAITRFLEQQQELQDSTEDLVSNIERLRQEVIVAEDTNSNSLIVSASPEYFSQITEIIQSLDATPPQVIIQALLVEVTLDNTDEFGVELGFQDPLLFTRSIVASADDLITIPTVTNVPGVGQVESTSIISQSGTPGFNFNNTQQALGNNASGSRGAVGTQGLSNFSLGRQNGDLGFGGFVFSAQSDAVNVLIRALAARRTVHILSRPQIRATHNNLASIRVGQEIPIVNGVTTTENFVTPEIIQRNTGIILEVTPRITPDGSVVMEVYAEKSSLAASGVPIFSDASTGNVIESPIVNVSIADTTVNVPNGQTIVIGGMITKNDSTLERKVPWLGDLPILGKAFRYDATDTSRTELLIFLTPRIIFGDADAELIKQVEAERLHFLESEAEEIHGPIYSVPATDAPGYGTPEPYYGEPIQEHVIPHSDSFAPTEPPEFQSRNTPRTRRPSSDNGEPAVARAASRNAAGRRTASRRSTTQQNEGTNVRPVSDERDTGARQPIRSAAYDDSDAATTVDRDEWVRRYIEDKRRSEMQSAREVEDDFDVRSDDDAIFDAAEATSDDEFDFSQFEE